MKKLFISEDNKIIAVRPGQEPPAGYTELSVSVMPCRRFLYLLANPEPISLESAAKEFEIRLHREVFGVGELIITDSDSDIAVFVSDPENASKLYRFVESDQAECQEVTE